MEKRKFKIQRFRAVMKTRNIQDATSQESLFLISQQFLLIQGSELMRELRLLETDLRNLTIVTSMIEPRLNRHIIVSLSDVDCVITYDSLYLFYIQQNDNNNFGNSFAQLFQQSEQQEKGTKFAGMFEVLALEAVLRYTVDCQRETFWKIQNAAKQLLGGQVFKIQNQTQLNLFSEQLTTLRTDCVRAAQTLLNVLQSNVSMLSFYNQVEQERRQGYLAVSIMEHVRGARIRQIQDYDLYDLVEIYYYQLNAIKLEIDELLDLIDNELDMANLTLNDRSNYLMNFELIQAFLMAAIDVGAVIAGMFGMNVLLPSQNRGESFAIAVGVLLGVTVCVFGGFFFVKIMIIDQDVG